MTWQEQFKIRRDTSELSHENDVKQDIKFIEGIIKKIISTIPDNVDSDINFGINIGSLMQIPFENGDLTEFKKQLSDKYL